ncbi:hypothetical protein BYT27DRAFT_7260182 [Phlegmacium glaucopus]|nr:hypothetical protein BYT27DRAFT_7260182 [Phlegmacium glaucopus]
MQRRDVYLRSDFRYGPDDPTLWPQPYLLEYPHLGTIPRRPEDSNDSLSIMWWNPTREDFRPLDNGVLDGLGQLSISKYWMFEGMMKEMQERIFEYRKKCHPNPPNSLLLLLATAMSSACICIGSLKSAFGQMRFNVTEFQHYYLKIRALLDYLEIYKPRMDGLQPAATTVANCIGAFTNTLRVAQYFFTAGLPVWVIRPWKTGPFPYNILAVVPPLNPADSLCISQHEPPFPVIFRGFMNTCEKHDTLHTYSRTWLVFKDPFQDDPASKDLGPTTSKPQTIQSAGRDKFSPLDSSLSPFPISAWSAALRDVDQSPSHLVEISKASTHFGHYVFPDPGLFVTPANHEKKARFVESWLQAREAWLMHVANEASLAMSSQNWRDFLSTDLSNTQEKGDTKAAKRRQQILNMLTPKSDFFLEIKTRSTLGEPLIWQGKRYLPGELPAEHIVREILWELYQLNFAYEFLSLDRRACIDLDMQDNSQLIKRQAMISQCFPIDPFKRINLLDHNCGLAATNLDERLPFVLALVRVMQSWKGNKPPIFALATKSHHEISECHATELEQAATKYYCQQFFNHFGRAAQVPHRIFPTQMNLARFM